MHVVATAGHVDHGKSTLVRALTGQDPDRLEEEHRRGLSIQLGYCWTELDTIGAVAFVDVPGHERFLPMMLAGIGPVPAALLVVAADDPWMPQAAEHLAALDALGVRHGVVAVTRADLADPAPAVRRAREQLSRTTLAAAPVVPVSGATGLGLDELRAGLTVMLRSLPDPEPDADVRLWVDRRFTVRGAGTVVTGTLPAGTVRRGDVLAFGAAGETTLRVRGVQSLGTDVDAAVGVARVALNVVGDDLDALDRGAALVTPGAWRHTGVLDVRLRPALTPPRQSPEHAGEGRSRPPERPVLHVGATSVAAHCRPLSGDLVRLTLDRPLPLRIGDRALLRDPGNRALWGVRVLDPAPPPLRRRGAAARRAADLADDDGTPDLVREVGRRGLVDAALLRRIGVPVADLAPDAGVAGSVREGDWLMSAERAETAARDVTEVVREHDAATPLDPGLPLAAIAEKVGLPTAALVAAVVRPPLLLVDGRVTAGRTQGLPPDLERAVAAVHDELAERPFAAPTADRLASLGLDAKALAVAAKTGRLLRVAPGIVLLPGADRQAAAWLADLSQPFTTSEARKRLDTSRRVVLPLLEHLDRTGVTRRLPDDRRELRDAPGARAGA